MKTAMKTLLDKLFTAYHRGYSTELFLGRLSNKVCTQNVGLDMMNNNSTDWIPISLKFRGKCVECGKVITSGRALWSKSTKAIKHLDCSIRKADQETSTEYERFATHGNELQSSRPKRYWKTIVPKCFICGKEESVDDQYDFDESNNFIQNKCQYYICKSCLQREDAFETYRQTFLQKIKRYIK
jgi:uncharacterized protein YlaI